MRELADALTQVVFVALCTDVREESGDGVLGAGLDGGRESGCHLEKCRCCRFLVEAAILGSPETESKIR